MQESLFSSEEAMKELVFAPSKKNVLSKEEKAFNKLLEKIQKLQYDFNGINHELSLILQKYYELIEPLKQQKKVLQQNLIKALYKKTVGLKYSKFEKQMLEYTIWSMLNDFNFLEEGIDQELKEIWLTLGGSEEEEKEADEAIQKLAKEQMQQLFRSQGFDIDLSDFDINEDPAEFMAKLQEQMAKHGQEKMFRERLREDKPGKKTKKQIEKEEKEKIEKELKERDIKAIYRQLVKRLHPDLEQNSEEKLKKQELMKVLTKAYEEKNIYELLRMEIEYLDGGAGNIQEMNRGKLKNYTLFLKEQVRQTEADIFDATMHPRYAQIQNYIDFNWKLGLKKLYNHHNNLKKNIGSTEIQIQKLAVANKKDVMNLVKVFAQEMEEKDHTLFFM